MMNAIPELPPLPPLLQTEQLIARYGVSAATLSRWASYGNFPRPTRFGRRCYWPAATVLAWERERFGAEGAAS
jgi:predicted DNA-binding transcriptional regulator AlpA